MFGTVCSHLKPFGLSPKYDSVHKKRSSLALLLVVVLQLTFLYTEIQLCTKKYSLAFKLVETLTNVIAFLMNLADFLLPLFMEKELRALVANIESIEDKNHDGSNKKYFAFAIANCVFIASQVLLHGYLRFYETNNDFKCVLPLLMFYILTGVGYVRGYSMVLLIMQRLEYLNVVITQELLAQKLNLKILDECLKNYDKMLDSVELYSRLFGFQVFCLCLIFETTMVQNVILFLHNKDILTFVNGVFLTERTLILTVSISVARLEQFTDRFFCRFIAY